VWVEKHVVEPFERALRVTLPSRVGAFTALAVNEAFNLINGASFTVADIARQERKFAEMSRTPELLPEARGRKKKATWEEIAAEIRACTLQPNAFTIARRLGVSRATVERRRRDAGFIDWRSAVKSVRGAAKKK
jgi:hypothetical protein